MAKNKRMSEYGGRESYGSKASMKRHESRESSATERRESRPVMLGGPAQLNFGGVKAKNTGGYAKRKKAASVGTTKSKGWARGKKTM